MNKAERDELKLLIHTRDRVAESVEIFTRRLREIESEIDRISYPVDWTRAFRPGESPAEAAERLNVPLNTVLSAAYRHDHVWPSKRDSLDLLLEQRTGISMTGLLRHVPRLRAKVRKGMTTR